MLNMKLMVSCTCFLETQLVPAKSSQGLVKHRRTFYTVTHVEFLPDNLDSRLHRHFYVFHEMSQTVSNWRLLTSGLCKQRLLENGVTLDKMLSLLMLRGSGTVTKPVSCLGARLS